MSKAILRVWISGIAAYSTAVDHDASKVLNSSQIGQLMEESDNMMDRIDDTSEDFGQIDDVDEGEDDGDDEGDEDESQLLEQFENMTETTNGAIEDVLENDVEDEGEDDGEDEGDEDEGDEDDSLETSELIEQFGNATEEINATDEINAMEEYNATGVINDTAEDLEHQTVLTSVFGDVDSAEGDGDDGADEDESDENDLQNMKKEQLAARMEKPVLATA